MHFSSLSNSQSRTKHVAGICGPARVVSLFSCGKQKENLSIGGKQLAQVLQMFIPAVRRDADRWEPYLTCSLEGQFREQGRPLWEALVMFSASDLKPEIQSIKEDNININHSVHGWNTNLNTKNIYNLQNTSSTYDID